MTDWTEKRSSVRDRRVQYETHGLDVGDLDPDPMAMWQRWHDEAYAVGVAEPNAMSLATVDVGGGGAGLDMPMPDVRVVLVRGADAGGFAFFTNYASAKSRQLSVTSVAAGVFAWLDLHRQVRVRGVIAEVSGDESDLYFASRPRASQIGAWASPQSEPITDRAELEARVAEVEARFDGADVPRPPHWGGWRLVPTEWEFWQGRPNRLHDRLRYARPDVDVDGGGGDGWEITRLAP